MATSGSNLTIPGPVGATMGAYVVKPSTAPPWPGVVVLHEAFGLNDDIRSIADRFADHGYLALAPDLFSWGLTPRCLVSAFRAMMKREGRAFDDIAATRAYLAADADCNGHIGVIGFCMGGGFALACAPRGLFDASSVNYGLVPKDAEAMLSGSCPVVGSYGAKDRGMKGKAAVLEDALTSVGVDHDVKEYPEANHSFLNHHEGWQSAFDRIGFGYHEESADDAWRRIFQFFDRHVRAG